MGIIYSLSKKTNQINGINRTIHWSCNPTKVVSNGRTTVKRDLIPIDEIRQLYNSLMREV